MRVKLEREDARMDDHELRKHLLGSKKTERIIFAATPETKAALEAVPGVRNVEVSLEEGKATLEAGMVANNAKLIAAVEGAGFKAAVADPANHAGGGAF